MSENRDAGGFVAIGIAIGVVVMSVVLVLVLHYGW